MGHIFLFICMLCHFLLYAGQIVTCWVLVIFVLGLKLLENSLILSDLAFKLW